MVGEKVVFCMRVQSDRPKMFKDGTTCWMHSLNGEQPRQPYRKPEREQPIVDCRRVLQEWDNLTREADLLRLALSLGVRINALSALGCVRSPESCDTYGFPMRDGKGGIIGIRLRRMNGDKWAVPGSHNGLFVPITAPNHTCYVCEGPTDTAAALSIGAYAVGRPSCSGGVLQLVETVKRQRLRRVVVLADCDDPGLRGAMTLVEHMPVSSCILALPCKDMRQFVNQGGDAATLNALVSQLVWRNNGNIHTTTTERL